MFDPFEYQHKTPETMLLGITNYDYLMEWCNDDSERAYFLLDVFFNRDEVLVKKLLTSSIHSYFYANDILKGPFVLGEKPIGNHPIFAFKYAYDILKGPFPLGEEAIGKDGVYAYYYARYILNKRFPLGEKTILNSQYKDHYLSFIE